MKLKKILAALAATTMVATAFSGITASAASYGEPEFTLSFSDVYEDEGTMCVDVTVGYKNFENFAAYVGGKKKSGKGIAALSVELSYDQDKLEYYGGEKNVSSGLTTVGSGKPVIAGAYAGEAILTDSEKDIVTFWFGFKGDVEPVTMTIDNYEFTIRDIAAGTTADEIYGSAKDDKFKNGDATFSNGSSEPVEEYVNVTTDGNVNGVDDGQVVKGSVVTVSAKAVEGKTAQLYANGAAIDAGDYTVNEDTSFTVVYTDIPVVNPYTYKVADYGKNEAKAGIFYTLAIKNSENVMTLGVAGKAFTATDVPVVEGDTELTMTYVILGVPANLLTDVPADTTLTGAVNGAYELAE